MKCKIVKQKNPFGEGCWYMFYCGKCGATINMNYAIEDRLKCEACGESIQYKDTEKITI